MTNSFVSLPTTMELKKILFLSIAFFGLVISKAFASSNPADTTTTTSKIVKVGPPQMGLLVDSAQLLRMALDQKFVQKQKEEAGFKNYLELRQLYLSLDAFETYMPTREASIAILNNLFETFLRERNLKNQALVLNTFGVFYGKQGNLDKASQYFREALQVKELLNDKHGVVKTTEILAVIAKMRKDYDDAIFYQEYNLRVNSSLQKANDVAKAYTNIAALKSLQRKYKDAEFYILKKALPLYTRMGNKNGRMLCFEHLAEMYHLQERYSEAQWFYLQANIMADKLNDAPAQVSALLNLARIKNRLGEIDRALSNYKQAELLAVENNYISKLIEIKGDVGELYRKEGNYPAAGHALQEYNTLKTSFLKSNGLPVF